MKLGFRKKMNRKYTLLVVPEGTNPVFRFKFRFSHLLILIITASVLLSTVLILFAINRYHSGHIGRLEAKLATSSSPLSNTAVGKEKALDSLLAELMDLSEKSKTIETKLAELEQLEAQLKSVTGGSKTPSQVKSPSSNGAKALSSEAGGVGGESIPLSEQDIKALIKETKQEISASLEQMPDLQQRLEKMSMSIEDYKQAMRILPTYWPTTSERTTSEFGNRRDPFTGRLTFHSGLDIGGKIGDPIYAAAEGTVTETGHTDARGNYIVLTHPSGLKTIYMHLEKILVTTDKRVAQGDTIAELGSTGRSTGPHLHIEVIKDGVTVNPELYLSKPGKEED